MTSLSSPAPPPAPLTRTCKSTSQTYKRLPFVSHLLDNNLYAPSFLPLSMSGSSEVLTFGGQDEVIMKATIVLKFCIFNSSGGIVAPAGERGANNGHIVHLGNVSAGEHFFCS